MGRIPERMDGVPFPSQNPTQNTPTEYKPPSYPLRGTSAPSPEETFPIINPPDGCLRKKRLSYQYTPLPSDTSIRLLRVHTLPNAGPQNLRDRLRCSIVVANLTEHPGYFALSYTWGDSRVMFTDKGDMFPREAWTAPAFEIECDGLPVSVATNLYTALISLRGGLSDGVGIYASALGDDRYQSRLSREGDYFYLWVDALCINQRDLGEKGRQIPLMGRIYSQARTTWMWLGGGEPLITQGAPAAWGKLEQVAERLETQLGIDGSLMEEQVLSKRLEAFDICDPAAYVDIGLDPIKPMELIGFYLLFRRSWCKRAWTYQEWVLSPRSVFLCGSVILSSQRLFDILQTTRGRWLARIENFVRAYIVDPETICTPKESSFDADENLESLRLFCPDYDHRLRGNVGILHVVQSVKAVLGHRSSNLKGEDYVQSLPAHGAPKLPLWSMNDLRSLEVTDPRDHIYAFYSIFREHAARSGSAYFPTPDYTKAVRDVYTDAAGLLVADVGLALLGVREPRSDNDGDNPLDLPSWVPDFGCWFVPIFDGGAEEPGSKWYRADAGLESPAPPLEVKSGHLLGVQGYRVDTVIRSHTMRMDTHQGSSHKFNGLIPTPEASESPQTPSPDCFEVLWRTLATKGCTPGNSAEPGRLLIETLSPSHPDINLCATAAGRLGAAQAELASGDEIWVLNGSSVPVALRSLGGKCYKVVGCMYAHGIMYGEGLRGGTETASIDLV
ncbi:hypothetical protein PG995_012585 [Apiospora arundinis]